MGLCEKCGREMMTALSCPDGYMEAGGVRYDHVPFTGPGETCHDCGVSVGGQHHPLCDRETCPKCGGQLLSCDCFAEDDEDADA